MLRPRLLMCDEMTAMPDASTATALVAAVESYRASTGAALPAVGHDRTLLERWCDRPVHCDRPPRPLGAERAGGVRHEMRQWSSQ
ncbi:ABC-type glutathione transport system ATPase component [Streptomyces luteogriseus]|nr:hypothetical protein [Streptomyces luteogriseus]MDQ0716917.1 ABC-type glutathione transport system ATPase component [Streptomyces luteogriseus]